MANRLLDADAIIATLSVLTRRIDERFPGAGLVAVNRDLEALAAKAKTSVARAQRPILGLRVVTGALGLLVVTGLATTFYGLSFPEEPLTVIEFAQVLEAGINDLVLIGIGIAFMVSLERRVKRRRVLGAIHELRSMAHIIDMHQLTKDPSHQTYEIEDTPSSPRRTLGRAALSRYLDYSSEMLSLTGKVAALYAERFDDPVVLAAVNEVESLATGTSGKIWQKLMILERASASRSG